MKKYNSPIFEVETFTTSDVVASSSYRAFSSGGIGNLDDGSNIDRIEW